MQPPGTGNTISLHIELPTSSMGKSRWWVCSQVRRLAGVERKEAVAEEIRGTHDAATCLLGRELRASGCSLRLLLRGGPGRSLHHEPACSRMLSI